MKVLSTRKEAMFKGLQTYEGSPCSKGHGTTRRTSNGSCIKCEYEKTRNKRGAKKCAYCHKEFIGRLRCKTCSDECALSLRRITRLKSIKKKASTPQGRFELNARQRLIRVVKRASGSKADSFRALTGISSKELISYIEKKFEPGMSWGNYGQWHIDHIRPCASFDLTDPVQQKECFHFTNLQPLWAAENMRKHARWIV